MKKIISFFVILFCITVASTFAYDLTDSDNDLLDGVEEKIITIIEDETNNISPEVFVAYVEKILATRELSERQEVLLEIIVDDMSWEYEIWEYASETNMTMTADECYNDEYYDSEDQMCYYEEDADYDDEQEYETGEFSGGEDEQSESETLATYTISWDSITLQNGQEGVKNTEVWNIFTSLIPLSQRWDFIRYEVSDDENSDTAAHVVQTDEDNTKWILWVNLSAFYIDWVLEPEESYATLIHEFAHVLTLNKSQVRYYPATDNEALLERFSENCDGNLLQEGCLNSGAYLDDFIDAFWSDKVYLEKVRAEEVSAYEDTPKSFITDYAGTNPGEDIAESFTYFVMRSPAEGSTIADEKLRFFSNYKTLESLRKQIRSNLAALK